MDGVPESVPVILRPPPTRPEAQGLVFAMPLRFWQSGLLLAALFGGLILNLMPCVFPILSLKALALAKAGGEERAARRDALAYSAGVSQGAGAQAVGDGVRHWHWGFPFFALFGLFWLMFLVRALYWGACWGWGPRYYRPYDAWYDDPARWDEWHRRAHEHNPPQPRS